MGSLVKLTKVTFWNYRVYKDKQTIDVAPPSERQNVILFGGMNGEGKTTFLEGVQLGLYGRRSDVWSHNGGTYNDYLAQSINRGSDPAKGAAIEIEFEAIDQNTVCNFKVQRQWKKTGSGKIHEYVQVFVDGALDKFLSEEWADQVERFIPARLSGLFFFDGEKIKHYADFQKSQELIERGLHSLLGIDLIDQLGVDLKALEGRIEKSVKLKKTDGERENLEQAKAERQDEFDKLVEKHANLQTAHARQLKVCDDLDSEYEKIGGGLFEKRKEVERERKSQAEEKSRIENEMVELAAGGLPLALITPTLAKCINQMQIEYNVNKARSAFDRVQTLKSKMQSLLTQNKVAVKTNKLIDGFFESELKEIEEIAKFPAYLDTDEMDLLEAVRVQDELIPQAQDKARSLIKDLQAVETKIEAIDRKLALVPDDAAVGEIVEKRAQAKHKLADLEGQITQVDKFRELARSRLKEAETAYHNQYIKELEESQEHADDAKILQHAGKVKEILTELRKKLITKRIMVLQDMILESYRHLMRKKGLIEEIHIDPETFRLSMKNKTGQEVLPDWLSAGERQLLVVSILWGFAKASGRGLPVIVDTPLGRLDSEHRSNLVKHYFPFASHQVILLSTDEEISGSTFKSLKPSIGHTYRLVYDESSESTQIQNGYFREKAHAN